MMIVHRIPNRDFRRIVFSYQLDLMRKLSFKWAKYLENDLAGDELLAGKSTKIEWFKPVFANDVLTSTCTVSKLTKRNEKNGIVELTFEVFNQNGELVLTDSTEMIVKCKPVR